MFSILILTKNEEKDLPGCLNSVKWCDDVHVFDSFSTDNTAQIATEYKAIVTKRQFDGYASQRNTALTTLNFKYDWVFILDADERIPEHLVPKLNAVLIDNKLNASAFRLRRRDYLGQTWLKYSQLSPFTIRLLKRGKTSYHREVNEVVLVDGIIQDIDDYFNHFPFSKGIAHWLNKHNVYSTLEAKRWIEEHDNKVAFSLKKAFFSKDFNVRRYNQKGIFYKMPLRPTIKLFYMLLFRGSFLDGYAGLTYSSLQVIYEYFIVLKTREIITNRSGRE